MKKFIPLAFAIFFAESVNAQNVGIGTASPLSRLHVTDSSVLFSAPGDIIVNSTSAPISGSGRRMMWYAGAAAFRAGYVTGTQWNTPSIGYYSTATGYNTTASGYYSTAMGYGCTAASSASTAIGYNAYAGSFYATAIGFSTNATASYSTAIGYSNTASGMYSVALGGYVSTNSQTGAFVLGDNSTATVTDANSFNSYTARFAGGYRLFSNSTLTTGVVMIAGGNSWSLVSDVKRKENFLPVIGEDFLHKISMMPLTTWNYKGQDVKTFRHYGPMAQDFYTAFGHDSLGEIGCDTLINQQDFLGVNLIAIQALEKRTSEQEQNIKDLKLVVASLQKQNQELIEFLKMKK